MSSLSLSIGFKREQKIGSRKLSTKVQSSNEVSAIKSRNKSQFYSFRCIAVASDILMHSIADSASLRRFLEFRENVKCQVGSKLWPSLKLDGPFYMFCASFDHNLRVWEFSFLFASPPHSNAKIPTHFIDGELRIHFSFY
jgi:hypothetical protein